MSLPLKFRPDDIAYDVYGIQWKIKSVLKQNNSIVINASNKSENRIFNENELRDSSEIDDFYQNNLNSKIESAQENLERFLPTLKDKYPEIAKKFKDITDLKNVDKIIEEMENLVKEWESENERVYKESSDKLNHLSVQVQEKNATIRNIQNSMRQ